MYDFPPLELADSSGLLAIGGDLSSDRLISAYRKGIFPWYSEYDPIMWFSPDPRCVMFPNKLKISKSMRSLFNQNKFLVTYDTAFNEVITACSSIYRKGQSDTWITDDMIEAYNRLHNLGCAHSVEVWQNGTKLVGGLYGLAIGKFFFGESMFTKVSNASKFGFISLVKKLISEDYFLIDCQQNTDHLVSLGAENIARTDFKKFLNRNNQLPVGFSNWKNQNITL